MISIDLKDPNLMENFRALQEIRKTGLFSDKQLQGLYDAQNDADRTASQAGEGETENGG